MCGNISKCDFTEFFSSVLSSTAIATLSASRSFSSSCSPPSTNRRIHSTEPSAPGRLRHLLSHLACFLACFVSRSTIAPVDAHRCGPKPVFVG